MTIENGRDHTSPAPTPCASRPNTIESSDASAQHQASWLVHEINNLLCSIRLQATSLLAESQHCEVAQEILVANRQIERHVLSLAGMLPTHERPRTQKASDGHLAK